MANSHEDLPPRHAFWLAIALTALALQLSSYSWPRTNHSQEVLPILARIEPGLFARDFAVQSYVNGTTPRTFYEVGIANLVKAGVSLAFAYLALQVATLAFTALACVRLAEWLQREQTRDRMAVTSGAILMLWLCLANHHGWNLPIVDPANAVPSTFAMPLALFGWLFALRERWAIAYTLFALAALLQFLVGFMPGLLVLPMAAADIYRNRSAAKTVFVGLVLWSLGLALVAIPMLRDQSGMHLSSRELIRIFGYVRVPHHWVPSSGGRLHWLNQSALAIGGLLLARKISNANPRLRRMSEFAIAGICTTVALICANYLAVEVFKIGVIAKLQAQRAMPFAHFAILLLVLIEWLDAARNGRLLDAVVLATLPFSRLDGFSLLFYSLYPRLGAQNRALGALRDLSAIVIIAAGLPWPSRFPFPPGAILILIIALVAYFARVCRMTFEDARLFRFLPVTALAICAMVGTTAVLRQVHPRWLGQRLGRLAPAIETLDDIPAPVIHLANGLRANTPADALVLLPPDGELQFVAMLSKRSVVFSWKNVPYTDAGIAEWGSRLEALTGIHAESKFTDPVLAAAWRRRSPDEIVGLARRYHADIIVSRVSEHPALPARQIARIDQWLIWRLD